MRIENLKKIRAEHKWNNYVNSLYISNRIL